MKVTPIKTDIVHINDDFFSFLDKFIPGSSMEDGADLENKVLVVTSKVLSMCEGNVVKPSGKFDRPSDEIHDIARKVVDYYTDPFSSKYNLIISIIHNTILMNGGVDSSNGQGHYILLPKDPYAWAEKIWKYLCDKYNLKNFGVIVSDSKSFPLKWGRVGTALAYCGFKAIKGKAGEEDLFGRKIEMTHVGIAEGIAIAAVLEMGEVAESQPLCLVEDISQIEFVDNPPTKEELDFLHLDIEDDAYAPMLLKADWKHQGKSVVFKRND